MTAGDLVYLVTSLPDLEFQYSGEHRNRVYHLFAQYTGLPSSDINPAKCLDLLACPYLGNEKYELFKKINLPDISDAFFQSGSSELLNHFSQFDYTLRAQLASLREARRSGKTTQTNVENSAPISPGTPLEEEIQIMKLQWHKLEELMADHFADFDALVGYKLKLLILMRWWSFDAESGMEIFLDQTQIAHHEW